MGSCAMTLRFLRTSSVQYNIHEELTKTELRAFGMRFALDGGEGATWKQIADALGLENERAANGIVNDAVETLQRAMRKDVDERSLSDEFQYGFDLGMLRSIYGALMATVSPECL